MENDKLDGEWLEALEVETDEEEQPETPETPEVEEEKDDDNPTADTDSDGSDDDQADDEETGEEDEEKTEETEEEGEAAPDDESTDSDGSPDSDKTVQEEPKPDPTKEAVKEALREIEEQKTDRTSRLSSYKEEVAKTLYPEGLDRQLKDSDGDPITGIDDLTKLINPRTNDYFTEEEAGSWLLQAQQKLNKDVEQVENFIETVAETNLELETGAQRVASKYKDVLSNDTDLKNRLLTAYDKTLVKDPNTGVTINAPVDVEEFFDLALEPMLKQQAKEAEEASKANKEAEEKAMKQAQSERGDLKPSGKAERVAPEDKEWAQAYKDYEEGVTR